MRFMAKPFLAVVGLLWLVAGVMACGQPAGQREAPVAKKPIGDVLQEHTDGLMAIPGVVGTAQGLCAGEACIRVFVLEKTDELFKRIPSDIEGYIVDVQETGPIKALETR